MLAQRPTPSQRKCPDLGPSLEALHLTAASWKGIQVLWGDKAMRRRPAWLTPASFPTPLRPSDLCCARLPLSGCPPVGVQPVPPLGPCFPAVWQCWCFLCRIQVSYPPKAGLNRACCLFFGTYKVLGPLGTKALSISKLWLTPWAGFAHQFSPISVDFRVTRRTWSRPRAVISDNVCAEISRAGWAGSVNSLTRKAQNGRREEGEERDAPHPHPSGAEGRKGETGRVPQRPGPARIHSLIKTIPEGLLRARLSCALGMEALQGPRLLALW